tara:strand:- start:227 stop:388 length:162 start_codon:yes stop_codon:yes gene_type:complete
LYIKENIEFILFSKEASLPKIFRPVVDTSIKEVLSGEKIYFIDFDENQIYNTL